MKCPRCHIEMQYKRSEGGVRIFTCRNASNGREKCPNYNKEIKEIKTVK